MTVSLRTQLSRYITCSALSLAAAFAASAQEVVTDSTALSAKTDEVVADSTRGADAVTDSTTAAQNVDAASAKNDTTVQLNTLVAQANDEIPQVVFSANPKEYTIRGIQVTGNGVYDKSVLIGYSGLKVGDRVKMPGDAFSSAIKKFWKQGLFSDVKIIANKIQGDNLWLELAFQPRPRISEVEITGVKKKDKEDIMSGIGMSKGGQCSPAVVSRAQYLIKKKLAEKGNENAEVNIELKPDPEKPNYQIVYIDIDKKKKVKVHSVNITGNENISDFKAKWALKKTKEPKLYNLFKIL